MIMRRSFSLTLLLLTLAGCATAPSAQPQTTSAPALEPAPAANAEELVDHWGDSVTTAVAVPVDQPDGGVVWEMNWIFDRYGRFRKAGGGVGQLEGRRYDVLEVEFPDGSRRKVYFDITEIFEREAAEFKKAQESE